MLTMQRAARHQTELARAYQQSWLSAGRFTHVSTLQAFVYVDLNAIDQFAPVVNDQFIATVAPLTEPVNTTWYVMFVAKGDNGSRNTVCSGTGFAVSVAPVEFSFEPADTYRLTAKKPIIR